MSDEKQPVEKILPPVNFPPPNEYIVGGELKDENIKRLLEFNSIEREATAIPSVLIRQRNFPFGSTWYLCYLDPTGNNVIKENVDKIPALKNLIKNNGYNDINNNANLQTQLTTQTRDYLAQKFLSKFLPPPDTPEAPEAIDDSLGEQVAAYRLFEALFNDVLHNKTLLKAIATSGVSELEKHIQKTIATWPEPLKNLAQSQGNAALNQLSQTIKGEIDHQKTEKNISDFQAKKREHLYSIFQTTLSAEFKLYTQDDYKATNFQIHKSPDNDKGKERETKENFRASNDTEVSNVFKRIQQQPSQYEYHQNPQAKKQSVKFLRKFLGYKVTDDKADPQKPIPSSSMEKINDNAKLTDKTAIVFSANQQGDLETNTHKRVEGEEIDRVHNSIGTFGDYKGLNQKPPPDLNNLGNPNLRWPVRAMLSGLGVKWEENKNPISIINFDEKLDKKKFSEREKIEIGKFPDDTKEELKTVYGNGKPTIQKKTLQDLSKSAYMVCHPDSIPPAFFNFIQNKIPDNFDIKADYAITVKDLLGRHQLYESCHDNWAQYGFETEEDFLECTNRQLVDLSPGIAHVQEIKVFVAQELTQDGKALWKLKNGAMENQPTIGLISISGIDFSAKKEGPPNENLINFNKLLLPGITDEEKEQAKDDIKSEMRVMWKTLLESGLGYDVLTIPPIGLGAFLPDGGKPSKDDDDAKKAERQTKDTRAQEVASLYFETLFEVMKENPLYQKQYQKIYYNPGKYQEQFKAVSEQNDQIKNITSTNTDTLILADNLAANGISAATVNPSDFKVTWGRSNIGQYWNGGHYVAEEHLVCHTTALLGSKQVNSSENNPYTNPERVYSVANVNSQKRRPVTITPEAVDEYKKAITYYANENVTAKQKEDILKLRFGEAKTITPPAGTTKENYITHLKTLASEITFIGKGRRILDQNGKLVPGAPEFYVSYGSFPDRKNYPTDGTAFPQAVSAYIKLQIRATCSAHERDFVVALRLEDIPKEDQKTFLDELKKIAENPSIEGIPPNFCGFVLHTDNTDIDTSTLSDSEAYQFPIATVQGIDIHSTQREGLDTYILCPTTSESLQNSPGKEAFSQKGVLNRETTEEQLTRESIFFLPSLFGNKNKDCLIEAKNGFAPEILGTHEQEQLPQIAVLDPNIFEKPLLPPELVAALQRYDEVYIPPDAPQKPMLEALLGDKIKEADDLENLQQNSKRFNSNNTDAYKFKTDYLPSPNMATEEKDPKQDPVFIDFCQKFTALCAQQKPKMSEDMKAYFKSLRGGSNKADKEGNQPLDILMTICSDYANHKYETNEEPNKKFKANVQNFIDQNSRYSRGIFNNFGFFGKNKDDAKREVLAHELTDNKPKL